MSAHVLFFWKVIVLSVWIVVIGVIGVIGGTVAFASGEETFDAPAIKVNTQTVSLREVEVIFLDSMDLIKDKLRRGTLSLANVELAVKGAWNEALETATQDKIIDIRADKRLKEIRSWYLTRAGENSSGDKAMEAFRRIEGDYIRQLRQDLIREAGGEMELRAALKRRGQTMDEWEKGLERELFRRDVLALELGAVSVRPTDIKKFYEKHPELFRQEEAWRLRRIRIAKSKFSTPAKAAEAAQLVVKKVTASRGENSNFAEVAAKVSDDPDFARQGGLLMRDGKADLPSGNFPDEEKIAATLKDGDISQSVEVGDYYLIVQRVGFRPAQMQTFEEAAKRVESYAYAEKRRLKRKELFEKLKNDSFIEVFQKDPPDKYVKLLKDTSFSSSSAVPISTVKTPDKTEVTPTSKKPVEPEIPSTKKKDADDDDDLGDFAPPN